MQRYRKQFRKHSIRHENGEYAVKRGAQIVYKASTETEATDWIKKNIPLRPSLKF